MAPMQKGDSLVLMILDSDCEGVGNGNHSYYEVVWEKKVNVEVERSNTSSRLQRNIRG